MAKQVPALLRASTNAQQGASQAELTSEISAALGGVATVRQALDYNSHGGVTFEYLTGVLRDASLLQNLEFYYSLADKVEELDPQWRSLINTRKLAVLGCEWKITPKDNSRAQKQKAAFFQALVERDWFPDITMHLLDAIAKGSAAAEIIYSIAPDGTVDVERIAERPMKFFGFDKTDGTTVLLRTGMNEYAPLVPSKFIVHQPVIKSGIPIKRGLAFCALGVWLAKALMKKNMWSYTERAGQPFRYATYAEGTAEKRIRRMAQVLGALGTDAYAVFPKDFELQISNAMATANIDAFEAGIRYSDEQLTKLALGQTQTTEGGGGSLAKARVQNEVRTDIIRSDARQLAATLKRDLFTPLCRFNWNDSDLPNIELEIEETADLAVEADIFAKLTAAGVAISQAEARNKFGYREPEPGEATTTTAAPSAPVQAPQSQQGGGCPIHDTHGAQTQRDSLDDLVDDMAGDWERVSEDLLGDFLKAAANATDPESLGKALQEAAKTAKADALIDIIKQGRVVAELVGRAGGDIGDGAQ